MEKPPRVILGSSSRWRQQVLRDAGIPFEVISPDINEKAIRFPDPRMLTYAIAGAKAIAVAARCGPGPSAIITADQVAVYRGEIREKPENAAEALRWLSEYGVPPSIYEEYEPIPEPNTIDLVTTVMVSLVGMRNSVLAKTHTVTVKFSHIPLQIAKAAIARGDVMHSCGAIVTDDPHLAPYVAYARSEGDTSKQSDTHSSIQGLPIGPTLEMLARFGVQPPKR